MTAMPPTRTGLTRRIVVRAEVYLTVNMLPDGSGPGEIFVKLAKPGSTVAGLTHAWAITISAALRRGVPWADLREKYLGTKFEPSTHQYTSIVDAVARNVDEMVTELQIEMDG